MNREIKFRGLRKDGKGWVWGDLMCCRFENPMILNEDDGNEYEVIPSSIGQFTGLKDKNGVEIYEGDKNQDGGVVIWNTDDCSFNWLYNTGDFFPFEDERKWCFITGNIHQP